jgi:hypothetical protein
VASSNLLLLFVGIYSAHREGSHRQILRHVKNKFVKKRLAEKEKKIISVG